ncbi:MAG: hypothetical protein L0Y74_07755 [candidate division Zixibacteria bacterium]|nr:hypothetical protein [candidate division Zixibacteria bacterium]
MNDPHVKALMYRLVPPDGVEFQAPVLDFETSDFSCRLSGDILELKPKEHYQSEDEARAVTDPFIRSWEIHAGLVAGRPEFMLRFESSSIVDRHPTPGRREVFLKESVHMLDSVYIKKICGAYPVPPQEFALSSVVEALWDRYCKYLAGNEPLFSMAYACLTLLGPGPRKDVARNLGIEEKILNKLGELTSQRGDALTARKIDQNIKPLKPEEKTWVEETLKAIIRHIATPSKSTNLTMKDLPTLP